MSRYLNARDRFGYDFLPEMKLGRLPEDELRIPLQDKKRLRELGRRKHEIANLPVMNQNRIIWTAANDLRMNKPPIFVDEICWKELNGDGELTLQCQHPFAQELEDLLLKEQYCFEHKLGNLIVEDYIESPLVVYDSGFGIDEVVDIKSTSRNSDVVSRHFHILIQSMEDVEKIKEPSVLVDHERTAQYLEWMLDVFDGILDIKVVGARGLWFTPWDYLIRVMGVQETLLNLYENPELIEATVKRYVDCAMRRMEKYRELGIWASNNSSCRVGSGGYGLISCLEDREQHKLSCPTKQMWGCGNAQIFSEVSPDMHWQFSLVYEMEWLKQFGVTYYGCCEPLHHKMSLMKRIPNLRKVSMSPWNKLDVAAQVCKDNYVMSCKPNPAIFATGHFSEELARRDIVNILEKTKGCSIEIVMKDISTVDYKPEQLWRWAQVCQQTVDEYYS